MNFKAGKACNSCHSFEFVYKLTGVVFFNLVVEALNLQSAIMGCLIRRIDGSFPESLTMLYTAIVGTYTAVHW